VTILMLDNRAQDHRRRWFVELAKSIYLKIFDGFLVSGSDSRDYMQKLGIPLSKIGLGYNCVDNNEIARLVAKERSTGQVRGRTSGYFLSISRLVAKKNVLGLVRAYRSYLNQLPSSATGIPLVICGEGPERGAIERLIEESGLEHSVSLVGEASGMEAVARYLAGCKALVLASTANETWGLVVNEAMAAGCPLLVSTQSGCARDLVDKGLNGFTFDAFDCDNLARHMLWFSRNEERLEAMGQRSIAIVERFTPAVFATSVSTLVRVPGQVSAAGSLPPA
jgi:glycosyltransferase involved in cell wall biosynthesis